MLHLSQLRENSADSQPSEINKEALTHEELVQMLHLALHTMPLQVPGVAASFKHLLELGYLVDGRL